MTGQSKHPEKWSSSQKFAIVVETVSFNGAELAEYGRKEGLYVEQVKAWRAACEKANAGHAELTQQIRAAVATEKKRNQELERELRCKEKALAETAALLILRKKAAAIWGAHDQHTREKLHKASVAKIQPTWGVYRMAENHSRIKSFTVVISRTQERSSPQLRPGSHHYDI